MGQFPCITIRGADPYQRGLQYGLQAKEWIHRGVEGYQRHFAKTISQPWEAILDKSHAYLPLLERDFPEELAEAKGIAEGSETRLDVILALNCRYEILKLKKQPQECTTGAVLPQVTQDGKTFLMQNWDYRPWVEDHAVILDIDNEQGTRIVGITEAGQLLRNGMSSYGIGLCANNLTSTFDTGEVGAPVTFVRRKALNCKSFQAARQVIEQSRRGVSCNFMLASSEGLASDLEATPGGIFAVQPEGGIVTHANHMVAGAAYCTNHGSKFRDRVLRARLLQFSGKLELKTIRDCLTDHEQKTDWPQYYPESDCREAVCSHVPLGDYDPDRVWKTIASSIYDLTGKIAYFCKGCPCEGEYVAYSLGGEAV